MKLIEKITVLPVITSLDLDVERVLQTAIDAKPEQEPVLWITPDGEGWRIRFSPPTIGVPLGWDALYTAAAQRKPLTDDVLVPLEILEAAANSLDSFCGNLGWGDADLQTLDNLFAVIEQHKAAHNIKEGT